MMSGTVNCLIAGGFNLGDTEVPFDLSTPGPNPDQVEAEPVPHDMTHSLVTNNAANVNITKGTIILLRKQSTLYEFCARVTDTAVRGEAEMRTTYIRASRLDTGEDIICQASNVMGVSEYNAIRVRLTGQRRICRRPLPITLPTAVAMGENVDTERDTPLPHCQVTHDENDTKAFVCEYPCSRSCTTRDGMRKHCRPHHLVCYSLVSGSEIAAFTSL